MDPIPVTLVAGGILGLILIVLSVRVSMTRNKTKVMLGEGTGDPQAAALLPAIRSHANFIEYVPFALILLAGVETAGASRLTCEIYALLLIVARIIHPFGMERPSPNPMRAGGAVLTWLVVLGLSIEALLLAA